MAIEVQIITEESPVNLTSEENTIVINTSTEGARGEQGPQGNPAPNVLFQYSSDAVNFHSIYVLGDIYFQTSIDGGITWSVSILFQGPAGPQGPAASGVYSKITGEDIGGDRVVIIDIDGLLYYADQTNLYDIDKILGITTQAGIQGTMIKVQGSGEMVEPSWSWDMTLPIYLGVNGLLTQILPTSRFLLEMGFPSSPISMIIKIGTPIILV
ncbi:MAG: hypothetical protein ABSG25_01460 [Bryobacteraceae bacterium]